LLFFTDGILNLAVFETALYVYSELLNCYCVQKV